jgi:hypothetical protein
MGYHTLMAWHHVAANLASQLQKPNYTLYDVDEEAISHMVNEELRTDSDDEMDLEIEGKTVSEESRNEKSESECETSGASVDGWKDKNGQQETQGIHIY